MTNWLSIWPSTTICRLSLYQWVADQRSEYVYGTLSEAKVLALQELKRWVWGRESGNLVAGGVWVGAHDRVYPLQNAAAVSLLRARFGEGPLSTRDALWCAKYCLLVEYVELHKRSPIGAKKTAKLKRWIRAQKKSDPRSDLLEHIPYWYWPLV